MAKKLSLLLALVLLSCQSPFPPQLQGGFRGQPTLFQRQGAGRVRDPMPLIRQYHTPLQERNPELIQLKYQAMAESPFAFYRATAFLFYSDLKAETALAAAPQVPLQGDFHLENMGTYLTAQNTFAYDLNDFDEAVTGPNSWDLARLAVSIHLAADETGFKFKERQELIAHFLQSYLAQLQQIQRQPALLQQSLDERFLDEKAATQVSEARKRFSRPDWLAEMTDGRRFRLDDKIRPVTAQERQLIAAALAAYAGSRREGVGFFTLKDAASRIAGKGSLGRYRYITLIEGRSASPQDDLILEIKEAISPSATYAGAPRAHNEATRIVQAFQSSIPGADPLLGITRLSTPQGALPAYVRELLPKETVNLEKVNKTKEYQGFLNSTALIIARMHARSGQSAALLQQTPRLLPAIQEFADRYAETVASDWKSFKNSR
ncbi:MAG TPA: DUF2252 family protein [Candidatus Obscuribacterales bacterium]